MINPNILSHYTSSFQLLNKHFVVKWINLFLICAIIRLCFDLKDRLRDTRMSSTNETPPDDPYLVKLNAFRRNHEKIVRNLEPKKFVYVVPSPGGYGNKLTQVINAIAIALLTDSAVIINITGIDAYIQEPLCHCFQTNTSITNELSYLYNHESVYFVQNRTKNTYSWLKRLGTLELDIPLKGDRLALIDIGHLYYELALNPSNMPTFLSYGLVSQESANKALAIKTRGNANKNDLDTAYRAGFEISHNIMNTFWRLKPDLEKEIQSFVDKHFNGFFVIGIQIRIRYAGRENLHKFIDCASEVEQGITAKQKRVKWFVASDSLGFLNLIKRNHSEKVLHANGIIKHVVLDGDDGYRRVLLDTELLARCDELILTAGSTFGFTSSIRSGRYPLFVNSRNPNSVCEKFAFSYESNNPIVYAPAFV
jgi:hypothetical protein